MNKQPIYRVSDSVRRCLLSTLQALLIILCLPSLLLILLVLWIDEVKD